PAASSQCLAQRSPYAGDASNSSTRRSQASGAVSWMNRTTASGAGGKPVRSKESRRISVARSASLLYDSPFDSSFARRKESTGERAESEFRTGGGKVRRIAWKDQCARSSSVNVSPTARFSGSARAVRAPPSIHLAISSTSRGGSFFLPGG